MFKKFIYLSRNGNPFTLIFFGIIIKIVMGLFALFYFIGCFILLGFAFILCRSNGMNPLQTVNKAIFIILLAIC
jgi:hypothetical protein